MIINSIKHVIYVGCLFSFLISFIITLIINNLIVYNVKYIFNKDINESFVGCLLLTFLALIIIAIVTSIGNITFKKFIKQNFKLLSFIISSIIYSIGIIFYMSIEFNNVIHDITFHLSYYYRNRLNLFLVISLPIFRLISIIVIYFLSGKLILFKKN